MDSKMLAGMLLLVLLWSTRFKYRSNVFECAFYMKQCKQPMIIVTACSITSRGSKISIIQVIYMKPHLLINLYHSYIHLATINLPLEASSVLCDSSGRHCHVSPWNREKRRPNVRPLDGFLYNKKAIWWHQDLGLSYDCYCHVPFQWSIPETAISNSRLVLVYHHSISWCRHWSHSIRLPCGYQFKQLYGCPGCFLNKPKSWCVLFDQDLDYLCLNYLCLRYLRCMMCLWHQPKRSLGGSNY